MQGKEVMYRRLNSIAQALLARPRDTRNADAMSMTLHDSIRLVQEEQRLARRQTVSPSPSSMNETLCVIHRSFMSPA